MLKGKGEHNMERPTYSSDEGYIQFIDRLEEYCNWLEEQKEFLRKRDNILRALEMGGVDNWEWIDQAMEILDDNGEFK